MAKTPEEQREYNRNAARKRVAKGLCCSCSRKAINGTRRCEVHTKVVSVQSAKRYQTFKAALICPLCKEPDKRVVEGKTCCQDCLDKQAAATAARRPLNKEAHKLYIQEHYTEWKAQHLCVLCGKEPAIEGKVQGAQCQAKQRKRARRLAEKRRRAVIIHYGGKCACCPEATFEFLEIDHINNDGAAHRKKIGMGNTYKWLIANNYPPGFQVLCSNCNHAKGRYGICPHELVRQKLANGSPTSP
jgi:hypothetical protein